MVIGFSQFFTAGLMLGMVIGVRNTVPSRMERMVPLGDFHISCRLYSVMRLAFGVMVAHFTATPRRFVASADSTVIWSRVSSRFTRPRSKYSVFRSTNGRISSSLIIFHRIRVISSPSISTSGVVI